MAKVYLKKRRKKSTAQVAVRCDGCGTSATVKAKRSNRSAALPKGWVTRVDGLFYKTFCPDCQQES